MKKNFLLKISLVLIALFLSSCKTKDNVKNITYMHDGTYHWVNDDDTKKIKHTLKNDVCTECGLYYNKALFDIFGEDTILYKTNDNPYGIDIESLGDDVYVVFCDLNIDRYEDIYRNIDKDKFYENFNISLSYEDAYYRTKHGILSGRNVEEGHLPQETTISKNGKCIRINTATYVLDKKGEILGYFPNSLTNESRPIWKSGGYIMNDDVAAYCLAFKKCPPNTESRTNKNGRIDVVKKWGRYGRVNDTSFSHNDSKYPYEPMIPPYEYEGKIIYNETDFGSNDYYKVGDRKQTPYFDGGEIVRGACRFIYISSDLFKNINDRHVFYTYNHYNDFQEYLNYDGGYGTRFGNVSAGNPQCGSIKDYKKTFKKSTAYPEVIYKNITDFK